jgi:hypothetical protein
MAEWWTDHHASDRKRILWQSNILGVSSF